MTKTSTFSVCLIALLSACTQATPDIKLGKTVYDDNCASCHGVNLEGQPEWRIRLSNGKLPAPPHDKEGHTWHHSDDILLGIIRKGLVPPYAPPDYQSDMPAWENRLTDHEIESVLAYIKSTWPEDIQKYQQNLN